MSTVKMGNDELILHVRKFTKNDTPNNVLGRQIWQWIIDNDKSAKQLVPKPQDSHWDNQDSHVRKDDLPKDATQFEFDSSILPDLYEYLETL